MAEIKLKKAIDTKLLLPIDRSKPYVLRQLCERIYEKMSELSYDLISGSLEDIIT